MGRHPIGEKPLTGAERVRRYYLKHATSARITELEKELARAQARIEKLRGPKTKTARRRTKET